MLICSVNYVKIYQALMQILFALLLVVILGLDKYLKGALAYGGPCFPRNNRAFVALGKSVYANALLAKATDQLNSYQVERLLRKCEQIAEINLKNDAFIRTKVGILGLSYKPDTPVVDVRLLVH